MSVISLEYEDINTALSARHVKPVIDHNLTEDEKALVSLGYKQEFKREFSLWSTFAVSFSLLGLLPSIASTLYYGMGYAGTAGMTWGWLIAMIGVQAVANSMAELCSSMPTSGGLYYAAFALAPPKWKCFAAWITGWSNFLVQLTSGPSVDYALACMILAMKAQHNSDYSPTNGQIYALSTCFMIVHSIISSLPTKSLAQFNSVGSILNSVFLLVALIVILAGNNRSGDIPKWNSNHKVWGVIENQTQWPDGIAILMSFISIIWTMSGYDSPFHLSEECSNANIAAPRAICMTASVGGLLGWAFQLVIAYTVVDIPAVINSDLGQPFVSYLTQCLSPKLVDFVTAITIIASFFMGEAGMIAASRVTYAYARDDCFPLSRYWKAVNKTTGTPVNAVWFNWFIGQLLLLLIFAGDAAIGAIFSVGALGAYISFTIPIFIKVFVAKDKFKPGPWNLGKYSQITGYISCAYILLMAPILCFPQYRGKDNTPDAMNWTVVVYFGPMLIILIWYLVDARKWFKGPVLNIDHVLVEDSEVITGKEIVVTGDDLDKNRKASSTIDSDPKLSQENEHRVSNSA